MTEGRPILAVTGTDGKTRPVNSPLPCCEQVAFVRSPSAKMCRLSKLLSNLSMCTSSNASFGSHGQTCFALMRQCG